MKAIHNTLYESLYFPGDVVTLSKIEKMKAIHNFGVGLDLLDEML